MADEDAREEYACPAEAHALHFHASERHPDHAHESEHADGVRYGLRLVELEEPVHPSSRRCCGFDFDARACGVGGEILVKMARELFAVAS